MHCSLNILFGEVLFAFVVVDGLLKLPTNITKQCSYVHGLHPASVRSSVAIRVAAWAQEGLSYEEDRGKNPRRFQDLKRGKKNPRRYQNLVL